MGSAMKQTHRRKGAVTVRLARGLDDLMQVFAVRSAVYVGEERCPYDEEYDGNDLCAAHVLACVDGQPAGVLRLRFFAGFVKFERLAVLPAFRGHGVADALTAEAIAYCRQKGFARALAHARHERLSYWARFGFAPGPEARSFTFSDYSYLEVWSDLEAVGLSAPQPDWSDPYVMIRPEAEWHRPGPLERSRLRRSRSGPAKIGGLDAAA